MERKILLVDDEQAIVRALQRALRKDGYTLFAAYNGHDALNLLRNYEMDMIISDMRMPGMDGHRLLRQVRSAYPRTLRVILSAYTGDQDSIRRALLDGSGVEYLTKPWDGEELSKTIRQMLQVRDRLQDEKLLRWIRRLGGLAAATPVYRQLMAAVDDGADLRRMAAAATGDRAVTERVLEVARALCGWKEMESANQAIACLGPNALKAILLSTGVLPLAGGGEDSGTAVSSLLWRHACLTNRLVHELHIRLTGQRLPDEVSAAGLLAGIGRIVLAERFPERYRDIAAAARRQPGPRLEEIEEDILGIAQRDIGAYLLQTWQLPFAIIECALFQHDPLKGQIIHRTLTALVHIASQLAYRHLGLDDGSGPDDRVYDLLGLDRQECEQLLRGSEAAEEERSGKDQ